jgi:glycosyltransferase involved in cell wall biosynthesis
VKIGLYDPFLETLGGGEKYFLTIVEEATRIPGAELTVFSPRKPDVTSWKRLNLHIDADAFTWAFAGEHELTEQSRGLDLLVTMSDDIPVLNHARRAVAMVQFPFRPRDSPIYRARALLAAALGRARARSALASYDLFLCNSEFTRSHIARRLGIDAMILAPPVDPPPIPTLPKKNTILAIGRFHQARQHHDKHQEVLIRAFTELQTSFNGSLDWELHLVGAADDTPPTRRWLEQLFSLAQDANVHFHLNAEAAELAELLATSSLFWHATGYGEQTRRHPERLEHFGIATAEAMLCGAVPLVVPVGGQPEIVTDGVNGRHWTTVPELVARTEELIQHPERAEQLRRAAKQHAKLYSKKRFLAAVREHVLQPAIQ